MLAQFPKNFVWGASTSAHQVEGDNKHSDWWQYEKRGCIGNCPGGSGKACNHWKLFDSDFKRAKELNNNAHRFSIEWAKIEPHEGDFNTEALEHYKEVFMSLKKHGLTPYVTLHHFTLPQWVADKGGWENPRIVSWFLRYVEKVVGMYKEDANFWMTLNEPLVVLYRAHLIGDWPPEKKGYWRFIRAYRNMIRAHKKSYKLIHKMYGRKKCHVGIAKSVQRFEPHGCGKRDDIITSFVNYFWNHTFFLWSRGTHDFIGMNYYLRNIVCFQFKPPFYKIIEHDRDVSDLGWEVYPHGIHHLLQDFSRYKIPIYITENGIADSKDTLRCKFIIAHILELHEARKSGVDLRGYFHWSLLDNFEWDLGFEPQFGLYHVNYKTQKRTLKQSGKIYADICKHRGVTKTLVKKHAGELMRYSVEEICEACRIDSERTHTTKKRS